MRNKSLFLLIACVCGTVAAIGVSQWMQAQNVGQSEINTVEIFVTAKTIDIAEEITPEKIRLEQWPADRVPEGSTGDLALIEGKFARQRFYAGEPIMPVKLIDDGNSNSSTIPRGYSVVSMKADADSSAANLVRPGDRVDVMAYFNKSELIPETTAKTVLRGIRVFAVDGKTERDEVEDNTKPARNIQLLIHKDDSVAWTYATELGKPRLQLCNPGDYVGLQDSDEANPAGQQFLAWLAEHQAAKIAARSTPTAPAPATAAPAPQAPKESGFKMIKVSGDKVIEYEWIPGQSVPRITGEDEPAVTPPAPSSFIAPANSEPGDYSYLNGSQSPFFQPTGIPVPGAVPPGLSPAESDQ